MARRAGVAWFGIAIGATISPLFLGPTPMRCERGGDCTLELPPPAPIAYDRFAAKTLVSAHVVEGRDDRGRTRYRLVLERSGGPVVLAGPDATRGEKDEAARAINAFIAGEGPATLVHGDEGWGIYGIIAGAWVLAAVLFLAGA